MANTAQNTMTVEEFFVWQQGQELRYELVDGVPLEMMSGASGAHDTVTTNIIALIRPQLRGSGCYVGTGDTAILTKIRSLRRADVVVTCKQPRADSYDAEDPRLVVEVLSPSNSGLRWDKKMAEYRRHPKLEYILIIDPLTVAAILHVREADGWNHVDLETLDDVIALPKIACNLKMRDIYEDTGLVTDTLHG
jgi:Uma2 family endonuclease